MAEQFRFATGGQTVLPPERASVFFDGTFSEPRIFNPEGVAIGPDGWIWCGTAEGRILRIAPDASRLEEVARTGGFILGLAFDGAGYLFACDLRHACVFRVTLATGALERFTPPGIRIPNFPVVDAARGCLYVSDSHGFNDPGPGVWRYDLQTGEGGLWWSETMVFANGMALTADGAALMVCETFARKITRIGIGADGMPAGRSDYAVDLPGLPDGLAFDSAGNLFVSCYEPSRILRVDPSGRTEIYAEDATAHTFCHPTNIAFSGSSLFTTNLGRWHITRLDTDTHAPPLVSTLAALSAAGKGA